MQQKYLKENRTYSIHSHGLVSTLFGSCKCLPSEHSHLNTLLSCSIHQMRKLRDGRVGVKMADTAGHRFK